MTEPKLNLLITGSEGVIGTALRNYLDLYPNLYPAGYSVYCCDLQRIKRKGYYLADVTQYDCIAKVFKEVKPELVVHLAGEVSRETAEIFPNVAIEKNVVGTMNVARLCQAVGAKIIYAGTSEVFGWAADLGIGSFDFMEPKGIYGLTKYFGERIIRYFHLSKNVPYFIIRIFMSYGPGEYPGPYRSFIAQAIYRALLNKPITVHKDTSRAWCFIEDVARAFALGITRLKNSKNLNGQTVNIGTTENIQTLDLARKIVKMTSSTSKIIVKPCPPGITRHKKGVDIELTRYALQWSPEVSLNDGLARTIEWQKDNLSYFQKIYPL